MVNKQRASYGPFGMIILTEEGLRIYVTWITEVLFVSDRCHTELHIKTGNTHTHTHSVAYTNTQNYLHFLTF